MTVVLTAPESAGEQPAAPPRPLRQRFPIGAVVVSMILSVGLRARFLFTPLTSDEGGYLVVARGWASGRRLYGDAWVDRPQGLIVVYRLWDDLTGGSAPAIRVMAMVFGCIAIGAAAYVALALAGARAAAAAAFLVAVASSNARIEGFIANGELMAGATGAAGVALACASLLRGRGAWWLFAGGVVAGCAVSIKQSGCDGLVAVLACAVAGMLTGERSWPQVLRECATFLAGVTTVMTALVVHGAVIGLDAWWYAVAGYRLDTVNATSHAQWGRLAQTARLAAPTILPLVVAAVIGVLVWLRRRPTRSRSSVLLPAWLLFSIVTFLAGGMFHRHYWITLTFPLAVAAGVAVSHLRSHHHLVIVSALLAAPSLVSTLQVVRMDRVQASFVASGDPRSITNELVGDWYLEHRTPGSTIYAMCASAALYADIDSLPPYPYLWFDGVQGGRGAQEALVRLFAGDRAPTFVVVYQGAQECNPSGRVASVLRERYTEIATVDGRPILELSSMRPDHLPNDAASEASRPVAGPQTSHAAEG